MIYVFYSNDPLAHDLGGGAEHFRCLFRALHGSGLPFRLVGARLQDVLSLPEVVYISRGSNFLRYYLALWAWFWRNRAGFAAGDVFHFHRNYAAWPKLLLCPSKGAVLVSYHNVTGRVLEGKLGRLAAPLRRLMVAFERRVARRAQGIICVSDRDRGELAGTVAPEPFATAHVIPAAFDRALFTSDGVHPPTPDLARRLLLLGRISHQKNVPLAIATLEALHAQGLDEFELTVAGAGEGSADLIRRIARSPVADQVHWIGSVPHDQVPDLLARHGILLLTSRYEASPTVVKEALRAQRPIVTTDVGDVGDWIEDDRTGFVCDSTAAGLAMGVLKAALLIEDGRYRPTSRTDALDEERIMGEVLTLYRQLGAS